MSCSVVGVCKFNSKPTKTDEVSRSTLPREPDNVFIEPACDFEVGDLTNQTGVTPTWNTELEPHEVTAARNASLVTSMIRIGVLQTVKKT